MKKFLKILLLLLLPNFGIAKTSYFSEGLMYYKNKQFDKAKFKFEQDIVYNPKNERAYLYLSKIFKSQDNNDLEEINLKTVILLNPKNEEAIYQLAKLKLNLSDYNKSKELNKRLKSICKKFCSKSEKLKSEIENLSKK